MSANKSSAHHRRPEREQFDLFCALPGDLALRDAQDLMAYPFVSLAKTKRVVPIDFRSAAISIRAEARPERSMAGILGGDVLIWAASQIVESGDAVSKMSRLMAATAYEILAFVGRVTSVGDYDGLNAALNRLQSTTVQTSIILSPLKHLACDVPQTVQSPDFGRLSVKLTCELGPNRGMSVALAPLDRLTARLRWRGLIPHSEDNL